MPGFIRPDTVETALWDVNNLGQMVGYSQATLTSDPEAFQRQQLHDLCNPRCQQHRGARHAASATASPVIPVRCKTSTCPGRATPSSKAATIAACRSAPTTSSGVSFAFVATPVFEPQSWALMLGGLAMFGLRRRS